MPLLELQLYCLFLIKKELVITDRNVTVPFNSPYLVQTLSRSR